MPQIKEKAAFSQHLDGYMKAKVTTTYQLTPKGREEEEKRKKKASPPASASPSTPSLAAKLFEDYSSPDVARPRSRSPSSRSPSKVVMLRSEETPPTEDDSDDRTQIMDLKPHQIVILFQQFQIPLSERTLIEKLIDGKLLDLFESYQDIIDLQVGAPTIRAKQLFLKINEFKGLGGVPNDFLRPTKTVQEEKRVKTNVDDNCDDNITFYDPKGTPDKATATVNKVDERKESSSSGAPLSSAAPMMTKAARNKRASFHAHELEQAAYLKSQEKKVSPDSRHIIKMTKSAKAKRLSTINKDHALEISSGKKPVRRASAYADRDHAFFAPSEKYKYAPMSFKINPDLMSSFPDPSPHTFGKKSRRSHSADRTREYEDEEGIINHVPFARYVDRAVSKSPKARSLSAPPARRYSTLEEHVMKRQSFIAWNILKVKEHSYKTNFNDYDNQVSKPTCFVKYMSPTKSSKVKRLSYLSPWSPDAAKKLEEDNKGHKPLRFMNAEAEERRKYTFQPALETNKKSSPSPNSKPKPKPRSPSNIGALGNYMDPRSPRDRALARKKELEDSGRSENNMPSNEGSHRKSSFIEYNIERIKSLKPSSPIDKEDKTVFIVHGQIKEKKDMNLVDFSRRPDPHARPRRVTYISPVSRDPPEEERSRQASFHTLDLFASENRERRPTADIIEGMQKYYNVEEATSSAEEANVDANDDVNVDADAEVDAKTGQSESERGQIKNRTKRGSTYVPP